MKNIKKLLALLLSACLLLSCFAALAEEAATPTVTVEDSNNNNKAEVTVDATECEVTGIVLYNDSVSINTNSLDETIREKKTEAGLEDAVTEVLTVNAGDVEGTNTLINPWVSNNDMTVNVNVGNVTATGDYGAKGVHADSDGGAINVTAKDVTATATDGSADGVRTFRDHNGDVKIETGSVTATGATTANGLYVSAVKTETDSGMTDVDVTGDVTAKATGNNGKATGIDACAEGGGKLTVDVMADAENGKSGDVTATGANSVGVRIEAKVQPEPSSAPTSSTVDVLAEGTVSGDSKAILFTGVYDEDNKEYNLGGATLTVWAANTKGAIDSVAAVHDKQNLIYLNDDKTWDPAEQTYHGDMHVDVAGAAFEPAASSLIEEDEAPKLEVSDEQKAAAQAALAKAINYIIKISDQEKNIKSAAVEGREKIHDFDTAHEEEWVKLDLQLAEGHALDGVYYNEEDEKALTTADADRLKQEDGSYWVKMLRGGGMLLKLTTHEHDYSVFVKQVKAPTCTQAGSDLYKCKFCELTKEKAVDALGHKPGATVKENEVAAKVGVAGSYDEAVYCTVCGTELSRKTVKTDPLPEPEPDPEPDPEPETAKKTTGQKKPQLVFTEVAEWRGLRSADRTPMGESLKKIAQSIEKQRQDNLTNGIGGEQGLAVRMWYLDEGVLVPEALLAAYNALDMQDRLLILMDLLDCGEPEGLSDEGAQVLSDIHDAIDAMTPEQQAARQADVDRHFLPRLVVDENGVEHKSVCIEMEIAEGAKLSYERYTFFENEGEWQLFKIETGEYK